MAFMAASHLRMLLCELEGIEETSMVPTTMFFDSKSAIAMGSSYRDTKHTRHIMRRYHYVRNEIVAKRFVFCIPCYILNLELLMVWLGKTCKPTGRVKIFSIRVFVPSKTSFGPPATLGIL